MYIKEPFEELDVMNDFLNNSLATNPNFGKDYCRLMIKNLIGYEPKRINVVAQKIIGPTDPEKRGIRLDIEVKEYDNDPETIVNIYDVEPHRQDDIDSHPRKARFYQAKIDAPLIKSGEKHFKGMPNLFIISITNYDPFEEDYMLYTIKNTCVELPEMCYDDGVVKYFFNTSGTKGGNKELQDFLIYLENSVEENIMNDEIRKLSKFVQNVKSNKIEREGYMTWGDKIDGIVAEAVAKKDAEIKEKDAEIKEKDAEIARLKKQLEEKNAIK
ncbi:MAG: hypothetical protein Q4E51_07200 [Lachnospiraceae bacterium]|nr:hypothetical protein [Lachnospiraceae bacterium]